MTREEALYRVKGYLTDIIPTEDYNEIEEIMTALKQEPCDCISREQAKTAIRDRFKDLPSRVEINTILNDLPSVTPSYNSIKTELKSCEDCISRQAVLDLVVTNHTELNGVNVVMYSPFCKDIKQLSPVTPKTKSDVLGKIRAKIEAYKSGADSAISEDEFKIEGLKEAYENCLEIIDRYTTESEE